MSAAAKRAPVSAERRGLLAKVHLAAKDLALTDDCYRDRLEGETGKRSAKDCSDAELEAVLAAFGRLGWRPKHRGRGRRRKQAAPAVRPVLAKARALWRALHHLGEVQEPSDKALAAFVKRQTGVEALEWLTPDQAYKAIEALKAWCGRAGFEVPATTQSDGGLGAKQALLRALWAKLWVLGAVATANPQALDAWLKRKLAQLDAGQCDKAAERLGRWLRQAKKETAGEGDE